MSDDALNMDAIREADHIAKGSLCCDAQDQMCTESVFNVSVNPISFRREERLP
jgi:hypothetical protein